jgi:hypothetical protein
VLCSWRYGYTAQLRRAEDSRCALFRAFIRGLGSLLRPPGNPLEWKSPWGGGRCAAFPVVKVPPQKKSRSCKKKISGNATKFLPKEKSRTRPHPAAGWQGVRGRLRDWLDWAGLGAAVDVDVLAAGCCGLRARRIVPSPCGANTNGPSAKRSRREMKPAKNKQT